MPTPASPPPLRRVVAWGGADEICCLGDCDKPATSRWRNYAGHIIAAACAEHRDVVLDRVVETSGK